MVFLLGNPWAQPLLGPPVLLSCMEERRSLRGQGEQVAQANALMDLQIIRAIDGSF